MPAWRSVAAGLVVVAVVGAAAWRLLAQHQPAAGCDLASGPCTVAWVGGTVEVDVSPRPLRAGHELVFTVRGLATGAELPILDFTMPGMDMGRHRATLSPCADGHAGRMTLTICPQGGSRWRLRLLQPDGSTLAAGGELVFDVVP